MKVAKLAAMTVLSYFLSAGPFISIFVVRDFKYFDIMLLFILAWIPLVTAGLLEFGKPALCMLLGLPFIVFYLYIIIGMAVSQSSL